MHLWAYILEGFLVPSWISVYDIWLAAKSFSVFLGLIFVYYFFFSLIRLRS